MKEGINMTQNKLIDETTDLSDLKKPYGLDLEVNGVPYDIYIVEGYVHTIGGRWGENSLWACPAGEKPTHENLIEFNGEAPTWGITFDRVNYVKSKWNETSVETNGSCWITRNGKKFYNIMGRTSEYALAKAQYTLVQLLEELPVSICHRDWKDQNIGRKIWYNEQPAIIDSITSDNNLLIKPDGIDKFKAPASWEGDYDDYADGLRVELLSPHIGWFRS